MPLHITSTTVSANTKSVRIRPTAKAELKDLIKLELVCQGPDADLNHIDVSQITDMSWLFNELNPGNIKIDKWDVSNVTNMSWMFSFCKKFNADLSKWGTRVSNVTTMQSMFLGCEEFDCDLSDWNVSNVVNMNSMFMEHTTCPTRCYFLFKLYWTINNLDRVIMLEYAKSN